MFAIPYSAQETPPLQDPAFQPFFFWPVSWDFWVLPQNKAMPRGVLLHSGLLQALSGHRKPRIETSSSWEIMDINSENTRKLWHRRESWERTTERKRIGSPVFSDRSSFLKVPIKRVGGRQFLCKDAKQRTACTGTKQPRATGGDGRIPDSLAQEDTCPFHIIKILNEIAAKNKCVEQVFLGLKREKKRTFTLRLSHPGV